MGRRLEAARDIAGTLAKSSNRVFLDADSLLLNVQDRTAMDLVGRGSTGGAAPSAAQRAHHKMDRRHGPVDDSASCNDSMIDSHADPLSVPLLAGLRSRPPGVVDST